MDSEVKEELDDEVILTGATPRQYLRDNEEIQYLYKANNLEIKYIAGDSEKITSDGERGMLFIVTNARAIVLAGKSSGNFVSSVPLSEIETAKFKGPGLTSPRVRYETQEYRYRITLPRTFVLGDFREATRVAELDKYLQTSEGEIQGEFIEEHGMDTTTRDSGLRQTTAVRSRTTTSETHSPTIPEIASAEELQVEILQMDPYEFEHFVASIWEEQGYETVVSQSSGDKGIDIEAIKREPFDEKVLIQVKRYSEKNTVGSQEIRMYATLYQQVPDVDTVVIVTSNRFTAEAEELASDLKIKIIDIHKLHKMIERMDLTSSEGLGSV